MHKSVRTGKYHSHHHLTHFKISTLYCIRYGRLYPYYSGRNNIVSLHHSILSPYQTEIWPQNKSSLNNNPLECINSIHHLPFGQQFNIKIFFNAEIFTIIITFKYLNRQSANCEQEKTNDGNHKRIYSKSVETRKKIYFV